MNSDAVANLAWELIFEELTDARYELDGPLSYDADTKKQLRADGGWDDALAMFTPPDKEREAHLHGLIEGLETSMGLCQRAIRIAKEREEADRQEFRRRERTRSYY